MDNFIRNICGILMFQLFAPKTVPYLQCTKYHTLVNSEATTPDHKVTSLKPTCNSYIPCSGQSSPSMDLCGTPLWDLSTTWHTMDPDFTPCFHKTVLIYAPSLFLLIFSPLEIYFLRSSQSRNIHWCVLNILRLSLSASLILVALSELVLTFTSENELFASDILGPVVKSLAFLSPFS